MTDTELQLLNIESFDDFEAGNSSDGFLLEEGSYDGAIVVGFQIVEADFEGKKKIQTKLLWQLKDEDGNVHTLRGNSWSISANEKSKMRIELMKWFDTTEWSKVCEILVKGGILVKHDDGSAHLDMSAFIGKRGKLLIGEKTSKKGAKYNVIMSISKTKQKDSFEYGEVPWFLTEGDDLKFVKLADGVAVRAKDEEDIANPAVAPEAAAPFGAMSQSVQPAQKPVQKTPKKSAKADAVAPESLHVSNPAPEPTRPAPVQEQVEDDSEDLPF